MRQKITGFGLMAFILGVFVGSFVDFGGAFVLFFVFLGAIFLLFFRFNKTKFFLVFGLLLISFGFGQLRYQANDDSERQASFEAKVGQKISLTGIVSDEPEEKENYTRLVLETQETKILIYAQKYPQFKYGDKLKVNGVLKKPNDFKFKMSRNLSDSINSETFSFGNDFNSNDSNRENDSNQEVVSRAGVKWPAYLAKDGIYYEMFYPKIEFVSAGNGSFIKRKLFALKNKFLMAISEAVPEPHATFLGGITIGARAGMPKNLQDEFRATGVAHIVALSGYNITIVAGSIMLALSFLPQYLAIGGGIVGVILFAVMTGGSATVLRASIMALLALSAKATGRIYTVSWALFIAGFFMVLQNPKILRFDTSFQLSFMATLGLIYFSPIVESLLEFVSQKMKRKTLFQKSSDLLARLGQTFSKAFFSSFKEMAIATVSAQVFVLPILVYKTGVFSVVGLPVNFLILPLIPLTMFFGFATGILGMINPILSAPFGWISYALLQYELWIVDLFAKLPFAAVIIPKFSEIFLAGSYFFLAWFIFHKNKNNKTPADNH